MIIFRVSMNLPTKNQLRRIRMKRKSIKSEKGSLSLEQVLFIGAIVAMSAGLYTFYDQLHDYFAGFTTAAPSTGVGGNTGIGN